MILMRCKGGLGNQLFQYAAGCALAARHGVPLRLDPSWYASHDNSIKVHRTFDLPHFRIEAAMASEAELRRFGMGANSQLGRIAARLRRVIARSPIWVDHEMGYNRHFEQLGPNAALEGYFQHPSYFSAIPARLRQELQPSGSLPAQTQALADELAAQPAVCVQVRRSDYLAHPDAAVMHGVCDLDYYRRAWAEVTARVPAARAWVFSDDAEWASDALRELRPVQVIQDELGGPPYLHKFAVMRACRHFISANSTFGWWAAWLGATQNSVVVLPRAWLRDRDVDEFGLRLPGWLAC